MNKQSELKRIICILITFAILCVFIAASDRILRPMDIECSICTIDAFHDMPSNSFDVMVYGSSHAWRGVNALEMYQKYGLATYNYGSNWQRLSTEALFFYDSLMTQTPKIALFETYRIDDIIADQNLDGEIYYTRRIPDSPYKRQYIETAFGPLKADTLERYVSYYFPISQFHSSWTELKRDNFISKYTKNDFVNTMGYYYSPNADEAEPTEFQDPDTFEKIELCPEAIGMLDKIVSTCKENDIVPIFFTVPHYHDNKYADSLTAYAEKNDIVYLDLFKYIEEMGLDGNTDFADPGHLNYSGAVKVSDFLGEYITSNYDIEDSRITKPDLFKDKTNAKTGQAKILWDATHETSDEN